MIWDWIVVATALLWSTLALLYLGGWVREHHAILKRSSWILMSLGLFVIFIAQSSLVRSLTLALEQSSLGLAALAGVGINLLVIIFEISWLMRLVTARLPKPKVVPVALELEMGQ